MQDAVEDWEVGGCPRFNSGLAPNPGAVPKDDTCRARADEAFPGPIPISFLGKVDMGALARGEVTAIFSCQGMPRDSSPLPSWPLACMVRGLVVGREPGCGSREPERIQSRTSCRPSRRSRAAEKRGRCWLSLSRTGQQGGGCPLIGGGSAGEGRCSPAHMTSPPRPAASSAIHSPRLPSLPGQSFLAIQRHMEPCQCGGCGPFLPAMPPPQLRSSLLPRHFRSGSLLLCQP